MNKLIIALLLFLIAALYWGSPINNAMATNQDGYSKVTATQNGSSGLPPLLGLTIDEILQSGERPVCYGQYFTNAMLQAYYTVDGYNGCVVLWISDTGESERRNPNYSVDIYQINVKQAVPTVFAPVYRRLGSGIGPIDQVDDPYFGRLAIEEMSLLLNVSGNPIVAWTLYLGYGARQLRAVQWDGNQWVRLGDAVYLAPPDRSRAHRPRLSWDEDGTLRVTWEDVERETGKPTILTRIWNGTSWE